jgi:hypothetical protein
MGRGPDRAKRELWARRLREFERGVESVAEFCDRNGLVVRSFHRWRRTLNGSAGLHGRAAAGRDAAAVRGTPGGTERMRFVPVEIAPGASSTPAAAGTIEAASAEQKPSSTTPVLSPGRVEAWLPGGVRILVPCDEPAAIRAVVAALVEGRWEEGSAC